MFDRIAPRYDLLNRLLSAGTDARWRRAAVDFLELHGPGRVLDLCTGTADLLIECLRRDPARSGAGIDLSSRMLCRGLAKLAERGMRARGSLAAGDAERLPFQSGSFHAACVGFGIRNVAQPAEALREVLRVLRPGGRFVILEFSMPGGALGALYRLYFERLLPAIGGAISGDRAAYSYLPASVARFPAPQDLGALMERAGFRGVRWRRLSGGIAYLHRGERAS
jgi:demethylmenaquinone methyltransferase/2-methoxy-6-polyprenyl-1,4-benzoquinol methylase